MLTVPCLYVGSDEDGQDDAELDGTMTQEDIEKAKRLAAKTREEKLQHDLFVLKKLNAAFEVYKEALKETKSSTDVSLGRCVGFGSPTHIAFI